MSQPIYYGILLGPSSGPTGGHVTCLWLGWCGAEDSLAKVRVVHTTAPHYRTGMAGLVCRERLIPMGAGHAA